MTTPTKKKTVLEKVAEDGKFTRAEVEGYREDLETLKSNAETLIERLEEITELDVSDLRETASNIPVLSDMEEAFDTISDNIGKAEEIKEILASFVEAAELFIDQSEYWLDGDNDKEDRAAAREEMVGAADTILSNEADLVKLQVDLDIEL